MLRRLPLAPFGLLLALLGPVVYFLLSDNPFARSTGAFMWGLMGTGTLLAVIALVRDRSRLTCTLSGVSAGLTLLALVVFFWLLDLPAAPSAMHLETAPDFTLADHRGQAIHLGEHCRQGPTLLLFYRGHW